MCVGHLLISAEMCVCASLVALPGAQHQSVTAQRPSHCVINCDIIVFLLEDDSPEAGRMAETDLRLTYTVTQSI